MGRDCDNLKKHYKVSLGKYFELYIPAEVVFSEVAKFFLEIAFYRAGQFQLLFAISSGTPLSNFFAHQGQHGDSFPILR